MGIIIQGSLEAVNKNYLDCEKLGLHITVTAKKTFILCLNNMKYK